MRLFTFFKYKKNGNEYNGDCQGVEYSNTCNYTVIFNMSHTRCSKGSESDNGRKRRHNYSKPADPHTIHG